MLIRFALAAFLTLLASCSSRSSQPVEEKLSSHAGQIQIGDTKEVALSKLSPLALTCKEWPIKSAGPAAEPNKRFSQIMCRRNKPQGVDVFCYQSVHLMIFNGRVNEINTQTAAVGGAPAEWTCRGR